MKPQMHTDAHRSRGPAATDHNQLTEHVIGAAYRVMNTLGAGFLEKVYENALALELRRNGLHAVQQPPLNVFYAGEVVGEYIADMIVEQTLLIELKACKQIDEIQKAQCINYLKATNLSICLLLNFGTPRLGIKRLVI